MNAISRVDLLGIVLLLVLAAGAVLLGLRLHRRATAHLQARNRRSLEALFGPRLARGQRPPADGRWHRVLREVHRPEGGRLQPALHSQFWLVDSEARQWHCALWCDDGRQLPRRTVVPLSFGPAALHA